MKLKVLLILMLAAVTFTSYAQDGGIRGKVVSRNGRVVLSNVQVKIESLGLTAMTDKDGNFIFENLPAGSYTVLFSTPDFEDLNLMVRVGDKHVQDLKSVIIVPSGQSAVLDDAVFAEFDSDSSSSDTQALPSSLSSSKDLFNNIASYRFSEMRFNVRGYDSQYSDIYLNGIRFNDAMTGYGPWSLWSGLNDATRNQENYTGLEASDFGIGGIGGMTNVNARASQMRKGFRVSVSNGNQMYRFRAMVSYGSGQLDNGWSYAFSVGTRQGGNGYVDGVYYNSYSYFASAEKLFGQNHRLALTLLASPSERGAQQASTDEAYALFGNNYYNPNVGYQAGKLRNSRVRNTHEPIVMLNYTWDMSENTRLNAATSLRFGRNGYSALTWNAGADPRGDYYRYMPNSDKTQIVPGITTDETIYFYAMDGAIAKGVWDGMLDYDKFFQTNMRNIDTDPVLSKLMGNNSRSNYMIEERHTDQLDYNLAVNVQHNMRHNMRIVGGANLRVNRTNYYSEVKDLLGGDYWYDIDKFAERDMASAEAYQNDLDYYWATGHARIARAGDKYGYYYRAHLLETNAWANYTWGIGGFSLGVSGSVGYSNMYREGMWRKGLFPNDSKGDSKKLDYLTYDAKLSLGYKFSGAHSIEANVAYMQQAPKFATAFVSPRTRNTTTPGLKAEKVFGADLTYNLNLPYIKARLSGYYTTIEDQSKVISFYDDTRSSFTNFAMSGIDKRYYGVELGLSVPVWNGLTDLYHPTQVLADCLTIMENIAKPLNKVKLVYVGDARNNMGNSLMIISAKLGMHFVGIAPKALFPEDHLVEEMRELAKTTGAKIEFSEDIAAVDGADAIYTDVWVSMGEEAQFEERIKLLTPYRVTMDMMNMTHNPDCIFLHCLPSFHDLETSVGREIYEKYGVAEQEVTDEVFRAPCSKVFDEAENRMHTIKAVMAATLA